MIHGQHRGVDPHRDATRNSLRDAYQLDNEAQIGSEVEILRREAFDALAEDRVDADPRPECKRPENAGLGGSVGPRDVCRWIRLRISEFLGR